MTYAIFVMPSEFSEIVLPILNDNYLKKWSVILEVFGSEKATWQNVCLVK